MFFRILNAAMAGIAMAKPINVVISAVEIPSANCDGLGVDVLVAMTEGSLGYILQQALPNALNRHEMQRFVVTTVTQVFVDEQDPACQDPSNPTGPLLAEADARRHDKEHDETLRVDPDGRG